MRYLGIDYGSKRVGLAISDEEGMMAFPYKIVQNNQELLDTIHNICGQEEVGGIVIGESFNNAREPNEIMKDIKIFAEKLNSEVGLPIYMEKEFMTTIEARGREGKEVNNAKKIKKGEQAAADASAAALILQRFLDRKNLNK